MPSFYRQMDIYLGSLPQHFGHVVYPHAKYKQACCEAIPIIYKESKKANPELTRFEVAFGELARLFLAPNLTPPQVLVKNEKNEIIGLACEHISHTIARRHILPNVFYQLQQEHGRQRFSEVDSHDPSEIPYYFLSEFPKGFFNTLSSAAKGGRICLDMASLAHVLTTSYTLEEDDLHKGNFGFYVVQKQSKPHVVFFKIDHDMMLADSVMSHCHTRWINWFHGAGAF